MNPLAWAYLAYLGLTIAITIWVARSLRIHGVTLMRREEGDHQFVDSLSHLLTIGFYLINFGVISFWLKSTEQVINAQTGIEVLSGKIGWYLVVLGATHFLLMGAYAGYQRPEPPVTRTAPAPRLDF